MESDFGNTVASLPQSWDWLRSENDEMSRRVWKAVETKVGKIRVAKTKERGGERGDRKKARSKDREKTKKTKKEKDDRSKENS